MPERITIPALSDVATESPTATHEPMAVHETSANDAEVALTGLIDQLAPPFSVVRRSPWPVRVPLRVLAVVPTTVQLAPATPVGEGRQESWPSVVVVGAVVVGAVAGDGAANEVVGATVVVGSAPLPVTGPPRQEMPLR